MEVRQNAFGVVYPGLVAGQPAAVKIPLEPLENLDGNAFASSSRDVEAQAMAVSAASRGALKEIDLALKPSRAHPQIDLKLPSEESQLLRKMIATYGSSYFWGILEVWGTYIFRQVEDL